MRILHNTNYDFVGNKKKAYTVTAVLLIVGMLSLLFKGLGYGIDFKGGTEIQVKFEKMIEIGAVRSALNAEGIEGEIKSFGNGTDVLIRTDFAGDQTEVSEKVILGLQKAISDNPAKVVRLDNVGPRIASDMKTSSIYAVIGSIIVILLYLSLRFEFKFAIGAIVATFHDVLVVLGIFSLLYGWFDGLNMEIDQTIIAAFLTIVGYSVNDTVVVFDRIREYRKIYKGETIEWVINRSINSTLGRTIMTSFTTLVVMIVLFFFGGDTTRAFSFAMILGIIIGTYSSIFVASPVVLEWQKHVEERRKK